MREGWESLNLKNICEIKTGRKDVNQGNPNGLYPFFTCAKDHTYSDEYSFNTEAILIAGNGDVGNLSFYSGKFEAYQRTYVLSEFKDVTSGFLYHVLDSKLKTVLHGKKLGNTMPYIKKGMLEEFIIPVPPLPEQNRIVATLDEAFEGIDATIANTEKNISNSRELFESCLRSFIDNKRHTWNEKYLKEICTDFGRGKSKHRPRNDPTLYGGQYPFIQTGDLSKADPFIDNCSQTYNDTGLEQSKLWPRGTVCVAIVGATIGESGILAFDACFPDSIIGMVANEHEAKHEYIQYLLTLYKPEIKSKGKGSARENINLGTFNEIQFPVPPLDVQESIVSQLDDIYSNTKLYIYNQGKKIEQLNELKQSLSAKAFSGELTADSEPVLKEAVG